MLAAWDLERLTTPLGLFSHLWNRHHQPPESCRELPKSKSSQCELWTQGQSFLPSPPARAKHRLWEAAQSIGFPEGQGPGSPTPNPVVLSVASGPRVCKARTILITTKMLFAFPLI